LDEGLSDSLEGVAVDMGHVVVDGVPGGTEGTLGTVGVVRDDVDAGDLRHTVDRQMVVCDTYSLSRREETAKANDLRSTPHLVDDAAGILKGLLFLIELRTLASHHVEEDAVTGRVTIDVGIGSPVLGAKGPGVTIRGGVVPLGRAPVFGIEADEVDAEG
jgi:hypothetical protein